MYDLRFNPKNSSGDFLNKVETWMHDWDFITSIRIKIQFICIVII